MALKADDLTVIEQLLARSDDGPPIIGELRRRFSHLSWVSCDASDVTEVPFRSFPRFDLHLLDGAEHCVRLTGDPASATGIVLAMRNVG